VVQIHSPRPLQIPALHWFTRPFPLRLILVFVYQVYQLRSPTRRARPIPAETQRHLLALSTGPQLLQVRGPSRSARGLWEPRSCAANFAWLGCGPSQAVPGSQFFTRSVKNWGVSSAQFRPGSLLFRRTSGQYSRGTWPSLSLRAIRLALLMTAARWPRSRREIRHADGLR
jgi:hypothetical protein